MKWSKKWLGAGLDVGITASLGIDDIEKSNLLVKELKKLKIVPNKVYVQYRENTLIEHHIKHIIYSIINHEIHQ